MIDIASPRLLVLGARGQVGWELTRTLGGLGDVRALDRAALDLSDHDAIRTAVRAAAPQVVVNAAAYTLVDRAESEPELAHRVNGEAPAVLAEEAARAGALLVHFSTDYVFDGQARQPYKEGDTPRPQTVYGASKLQGDQAILESDADAYIFRVGWVYGNRGRNFLNTIRRLALERDELRIVGDQRGGPTSARAIAEATSDAVAKWWLARRLGQSPPQKGVYHMAPPDHTTWHGFASAIVDGLVREGAANRPRVTEITSAEYPTPAIRPAWSVLDTSLLRKTFGFELAPWRLQLGECLDQGGLAS